MNRDNQPLSHPGRALEFSRKSWRCLGDDVVAAYIDGSLDDTSRRVAESHLADCQACRSLVGEVVAMRRPETLQLPLGLKERAFSAALSSRRKHTVLIPAFAGVAAASVVLAVFLVESPQKLNLPLPKSPAAPTIAKSNLPQKPRDDNFEVVRNLKQPQPSPTILFPVENAAVSRSQLRFSWKNVPRAQYYEIHVVSTEGDPVWEGESKVNSLDSPTDFAMPDGTYFVWIGAVTDGQIKKSVPVRFLVRAP